VAKKKIVKKSAHRPVKKKAAGVAQIPQHESGGATVKVGETFLLTVTLEKVYAKSPGDAAGAQLHSIAEDATRNTPGWSHEVTRPRVTQSGAGGVFKKICTGKVNFRYTIAKFDSLAQLIHRAQRLAGMMAKFAGTKSRGWSVVKATGPGGHDFNLEEARAMLQAGGRAETAHILLPPEWEPYFEADIYGLDPQLRLTWDSLSAFVRSGYLERSHIMYYGQPGSGKTTVCERIYEMVAEHSPDGAVMRFTASQTTKAGFENVLLEADPKPSLIIVEEGDKADPDKLSPFIDICNVSACVRKATATRGREEVPYQALVMFTVNNLPKFKKFHDGALASRLSQKIFFPRPSPDVLRLIGLREVRQHNGNERWVTKAMEIMEQENTNDPRRLRAILTGARRLMDGSAAKDWEAMTTALERESQLLLAVEEGKNGLHRRLDAGDG